jgi:hypothetical protein
MEPSLQPSFIFPSRNKIANYGQGIRDLSSATQRLLVKPSQNTNIDLVTALETPLTRPPALSLQQLEQKPVIPVDTPLYVQPGMAEGMTDLAKLTNADNEIIKVTSSNNALKRGNYKAAENLLGREVTSEEAANHTLNSNLRGSENNPSVKTHLAFDRYATGAQIVSQNNTNMEKKIRTFRNSDESLVNDIAKRLNIPPDVARELKTNLGYTGDSVLGYMQATPQQREHVFQVMEHFYRQTLARSQSERAAALNEASILEGESRPIHSGSKAARGERKMREEENKNESKYSFNGNGDMVEVVKSTQYGIPDTERVIMTRAEMEKMAGEDVEAERLAKQGVSVEDEPWDDFQEQATLEHGRRRLAEMERKYHEERTPDLQGELNNIRNQMEDKEDVYEANDAPMAPALAVPRSAFGPQPSTEDLEYKDENEFQGAPETVAEQLRRPVRVRPPSSATGPLILNSQSVGFTQVNVPLDGNLQSQIEEKKRNLKRRNEVLTVEAPYGPLTAWDAYQLDLRNAMHKRRAVVEGEDTGLAVDLLREANTVEMKGENEPHYERKSSEEWEDTEEMGGGIGGRSRRRRTTKKQRFTPTKNFSMPDASSFSSAGAVASGRLMQQTGKNAVPISAQIQVQETHQFTETPLRDWVKHPNYDSRLRPDPIPISQNVGEGVGKRARKLRFGGYMLDHNKLLTHNVLSLSHPSGKKVKGMPNMEVTPGLKQVIHSIVTGGKVSTRGLKAAEKLYLRDLLHKSAANVELGADVNVSPTQQLQLILGEIDAGNDSSDLKTQLRKLLPQLKRSKVLSAEQVSDISKHYL